MHGGGAFAQAHRIREITPDASILVIVRDPISRILSFYKYIVEHNEYFLNLEESLDWVRTPYVFYKRKAIYLADYCYDELIKTCADLFSGRVLVVKFEDMIRRPEAWFDEVGSFVGVPFNMPEIKQALTRRHNPSMSECDVFKKRQENLLRQADRLFSTSGFKLEESMQKEAAREPVMSLHLREKIVDLLRGKCTGYYQ